jgi:hypothetical protein
MSTSLRYVIIVVALSSRCVLTNAGYVAKVKNGVCLQKSATGKQYENCTSYLDCSGSRDCVPTNVHVDGSCYYEKEYGLKQCMPGLTCAFVAGNTCKNVGWFWYENVLPISLVVAFLCGLIAFVRHCGMCHTSDTSLRMLLNYNAFGTHPVRYMQDEHEIQHLVGIGKVKDTRPPIQSHLGNNQNCIYSSLHIFDPGYGSDPDTDIYSEEESRDFYVEDELNSNAKIYVESKYVSVYGSANMRSRRFPRCAVDTKLYGSGYANAPDYVRSKMKSNSNRYILNEIVDGSHVGIIGKPVKHYKLLDEGTMKLSMVPCVDPLSKKFQSLHGWGNLERRAYSNIRKKKILLFLYMRKKQNSHVTTENYTPPSVAHRTEPEMMEMAVGQSKMPKMPMDKRGAVETMMPPDFEQHSG